MNERKLRLNGSPTLAGIWSTYQRKIVATMSLLTVERLFAVGVPFVLGVAINDLIADSYRGILLLAGLELSILAIGTLRRLYDTRVYAGIYTDIADRTAKRGDLPVTKRAARMQLGRELVDFFEWELPQLAAAVIGVVGALSMLVYLLPPIGVGSLFVALMIGLIFFASRRRMFGLNRLLNNELERQVTMLESGEEFSRRMHLSRLARWRIHLSDLEARNFAASELLLGALLVGSVMVSVKAGVSIGAVLAIITYLIDLYEGLVVLPWTYQQAIRMQEIGGRMATA